MNIVAGWTDVRVQEIFERLRETHGLPDWSEHSGEALAELIHTILSQSTSDVNSGRAFETLRARFPTWQAVLEADPNELVETIRAGGLAEVKARYIQAVLAAILVDRGELDLEFLRPMSLQATRDYLTSLPGVGPKTAACVQVFALQQPALPVDTHVHRVARRLALIPRTMSANLAHAELERQVLPHLRFATHILLIQHGRQICKAQRPLCDRCPLADICPRIDVVRE